jgi:hypothetical protein
VPPDKTGLAPSEASPTLVPLEMVETLDPPDDEPSTCIGERANGSSVANCLIITTYSARIIDRRYDARIPNRRDG